MHDSCMNCGRRIIRQREGGFCWVCDRIWTRTMAQSHPFGDHTGFVAQARLQEAALVHSRGASQRR